MEILIKLPCLMVHQLVGGASQIRTREGSKVEAFLPLPWSVGSRGLMHSSGTVSTPPTALSVSRVWNLLPPLVPRPYIMKI